MSAKERKNDDDSKSHSESNNDESPIEDQRRVIGMEHVSAHPIWQKIRPDKQYRRNLINKRSDTSRIEILVNSHFTGEATVIGVPYAAEDIERGSVVVKNYIEEFTDPLEERRQLLERWNTYVETTAEYILYGKAWQKYYEEIGTSTNSVGNHLPFPAEHIPKGIAIQKLAHDGVWMGESVDERNQALGERIWSEMCTSEIPITDAFDRIDSGINHSELSDDYEKAVDTISSQADKIAELRENNKGLNNTLKRKNEELETLRDEYDQAQKEISSLQSQISALQDNLREKKEENEALEFKISEIRDLVSKKSTKIDELQSQIEAKNSQVQQLHGKIGNLTAEKEQLEDELENTRSKTDTESLPIDREKIESMVPILFEQEEDALAAEAIKLLNILTDE